MIVYAIPPGTFAQVIITAGKHNASIETVAVFAAGYCYAGGLPENLNAAYAAYAGK